MPKRIMLEMDDATKLLQARVLDLIGWGYTQADIVRHTGVAQSMVSNLQMGYSRVATYQAGLRITALHARVRRARMRAKPQAKQAA